VTIAAKVVYMSNLPVSSWNAAAAPRRVAARRAACLVFGWLAFWLGSVIYPCQAHHALPVTMGGVAAIELSSGTHADADHLDSSPAHEDGTCQELTAPANGALVASLPGRTPTLTRLHRSPSTRSAGPRSSRLQHIPALHPPPHTPLPLLSGC
jgi:hypothetical protein